MRVKARPVRATATPTPAATRRACRSGYASSTARAGSESRAYARLARIPRSRRDRVHQGIGDRDDDEQRDRLPATAASQPRERNQQRGVDQPRQRPSERPPRRERRPQAKVHRRQRRAVGADVVDVRSQRHRLGASRRVRHRRPLVARVPGEPGRHPDQRRRHHRPRVPEHRRPVPDEPGDAQAQPR